MASLRGIGLVTALWALSLLLARAVAAASPVAATVTVNLLHPLHVTDARFLSLGMDSNLIRDRWETFDFASAKLQTLARGLAPAYLRLMGTDGDKMLFVRNDGGGRSGWNSWPFPETKFNMTSRDWDSINK